MVFAHKLRDPRGYNANPSARYNEKEIGEPFLYRPGFLDRTSPVCSQPLAVSHVQHGFPVQKTKDSPFKALKLGIKRSLGLPEEPEVRFSFASDFCECFRHVVASLQSPSSGLLHGGPARLPCTLPSISMVLTLHLQNLAYNGTSPKEYIGLRKEIDSKSDFPPNLYVLLNTPVIPDGSQARFAQTFHLKRPLLRLP